MSLGKQALSGLKWSSVNSGIVSMLSLVRLWVLAYILSPEDFGLMAMVLTVLDLGVVYADTGVSAAIIHRQEATIDELSSLYWLNVATGVVIFLLIVILAPIITMFYKEPRLVGLLHAASLVLVVSSLGNQFAVLLQRDVQFSVLAKLEIWSAVVGAVVAIVAAFAGLKVWSLVWGQLAGTVSRTVFLMWVGLRKYRPRIHFCRNDLKGYLSFGIYQMADRTINYLSGRIDQLLIGNLLGAETLGYYNFAYNIVMQPLFKINSVITVVMFPIFAKIQNDLKLLQKHFLDLIKYILSVNAPLLIGLVVIAPTLIVTIFGQKWSESIPFIQILAFVALLKSTNDPIASIGLARGRADLLFRWNMCIVAANFIFMYLGFSVMKATGIALGLLAVMIMAAPFSYWYVVRSTVGRCALHYTRSLLKPIVLALFMGASVALLGHFIKGTSSFYLAETITFGVCVYSILLVIAEPQIMGKIRGLMH